MQSILRNRLYHIVLDTVKHYLHRNDLLSAWGYLNNHFVRLLSKSADLFIAALQVYSIQEHQLAAEYIWCLEILVDAVQSINDLVLIWNIFVGH
jgi:hypothetical protein